MHIPQPYAKAGSFALAVALAACTSVPDFHDQQNGDQGTGEGITVQNIVDHIKCELYDAAVKYPALQSYDALALLTLKVDDSGNLSPSTTFIQPYTAMTNRSLAINLQYGEARERTFTQVYRFSIFYISQDPSSCGSPGGPEKNYDLGGPNLRGDLGIVDDSKMGLDAIRPSDYAALRVRPAALGSGTGFQNTQQDCDSSETYPSFGTSMQFALTKGIGGGPSWTLTHFKETAGSAGGGGGGSSSSSSGSSGSGGGGGGPSGPLGLSRIDTDQLWIAFAWSPDQTDAPKLSALKTQVNLSTQKLLDLQTKSIIPLPAPPNTSAHHPRRKAAAVTPDAFTLVQAEKTQAETALADASKSHTAAKSASSCQLKGTINAMILGNLTAAP